MAEKKLRVQKDKSSETEDILSDPIVMEMLEHADRQYKEGKAIPLRKLISELGFGEDEL